MPFRPRSFGWSYVSAVPWRMALQRFSFILFIVLAMGFLLLGRVQPTLVQGIRIHVVDGMAPVFDAISRPMTAAQNAAANVKNYLGLRAENEKLRADNAQLKQWQNDVVALQNENRELHNLLHFKTEPGLAYISARVIADTGGPFARGLIVTAGTVDGVREGMAAMTGDGLIGRVIEAGDWSSRVLLITDLNSRIPVMIAGSGDRAILSGDNSPVPKLLYLPRDATPVSGCARSDIGPWRRFPPDLPVGTVTEISRDVYGVTPAADLAASIMFAWLISISKAEHSTRSSQRSTPKLKNTKFRHHV